MHLAVWVGSPWPHTFRFAAKEHLCTRTCRNFDSHDCHGSSLWWDTEEAVEHEPLQGLGSTIIRPLLVWDILVVHDRGQSMQRLSLALYM